LHLFKVLTFFSVVFMTVIRGLGMKVFVLVVVHGCRGVVASPANLLLHCLSHLLPFVSTYSGLYGRN
jgi:hypothetical protein